MYVHFWSCSFPPAFFGLRFSNVLLKWENDSFVILSYWLNENLVHLNIPIFMGYIEGLLSSSTGHDVNVGFPERSLDSSLLLRPPMPSILQIIRSLNSQACGYLWSDRLNFAVYQALLKFCPVLKIIFQINYLDFSHKLWFSQTQLATPQQLELTELHFSALLGASD